MKRSVGGEILLDMTPIEIEESVDGTTYTNITDKTVLDQLTGLKSFIGKSGMIKPVWCRIANGETDEIIVARGTLSVVDVGEFAIFVPLDGYKMRITVEFTQMENEDHEPLDDWYIDTNDAKYILISDTQALAGELADFEGDVSITGDVSVTGDASITGDETITGDLTVTGDINGEENPSVKPIYCHPITIDYEGVDVVNPVHIALLIFDNSDEEYNTYAKFVAKLEEIFTINPNAKFPITGGIYYGAGSTRQVAQYIDKVVDEIQIKAVRPDGTQGFFGLATYTSSATFYDGVNKIN